MLNRRSGLLGVSGISNDVRTLLASVDPRAKEALDLFVYRVVKEAGSLMATLGGIDALVFTAGIGERSAPMRSAICREFSWAGITLDHSRNAENATCISEIGARIPVYVIPADEELTIARATIRETFGGLPGINPAS